MDRKLSPDEIKALGLDDGPGDRKLSREESKALGLETGDSVSSTTDSPPQTPVRVPTFQEEHPYLSAGEKVAAALRNASLGTSMGASRVVDPAIRAIGNTYGSHESFIDRYRRAKQDYDSETGEMNRDQPRALTAAETAIPALLLWRKAQIGLPTASGLGAAASGINGRADLTRGQLGQFGKDITGIQGLQDAKEDFGKGNYGSAALDALGSGPLGALGLAGATKALGAGLSPVRAYIASKASGFKRIALDAADAKMAEEARAAVAGEPTPMAGVKDTPTGSSASGLGGKVNAQRNQAQALMQDPRYQSDPEFKAMVDNMMSRGDPNWRWAEDKEAAARRMKYSPAGRTNIFSEEATDIGGPGNGPPLPPREYDILTKPPAPPSARSARNSVLDPTVPGRGQPPGPAPAVEDVQPPAPGPSRTPLDDIKSIWNRLRNPSPPERLPGESDLDYIRWSQYKMGPSSKVAVKAGEELKPGLGIRAETDLPQVDHPWVGDYMPKGNAVGEGVNQAMSGAKIGAVAGYLHRGLRGAAEGAAAGAFPGFAKGFVSGMAPQTKASVLSGAYGALGMDPARAALYSAILGRHAGGGDVSSPLPRQDTLNSAPSFSNLSSTRKVGGPNDPLQP